MVGGLLSKMMGGMIGGQAAGAMGGMADSQIAQAGRQQQIGQRNLVGAMANKGQPSTPPNMMQGGMAAANQGMNPMQMMSAINGLGGPQQGWQAPGRMPNPYNPLNNGWNANSWYEKYKPAPYKGQPTPNVRFGNSVEKGDRRKLRKIFEEYGLYSEASNEFVI